MLDFIMFDFAVAVPPGFDVEPRGTEEAIVTVVAGLVWVACLAYAIGIGRRERSWLGVALLVGGGLAMLQEPMVDVNGSLFLRSDITAFETWGREMPLWALLAYSVYWGGFAFALARRARRGLELATFRRMILAGFALNLFIELPTLALGLYAYFGYHPMEVLGLPLYWLPLNCASAVAIAAVVYRYEEFFSGPRVCLAALLGPVLVPAASMGTGLAVYSALNTPGASEFALWVCALITIAVGLAVIEFCGRVLSAAPVRETKATAPVREKAYA